MSKASRGSGGVAVSGDSADSAISVVVPSLDEGWRLSGAVSELLREPAFGEVIVVDASIDPISRDVVSGLIGMDPRLVVVPHAPPCRAAQMNAGAARALGDIVLFAHADTWLPESAGTDVVAAIRAGALWGRFDVRIDAPARRYRVVETAMNARAAWTGIATGDQAIFVRRALFEELGGFAALSIMEDIELSRRLNRHGRPARLRKRAVTSPRRWESDGFWRTLLRMWLLRAWFWSGLPAGNLARWYGNTR